MRKNIFEKSANKVIKSIFRDESVFYPDYYPDNIDCRDVQINTLTSQFEPILHNKKATNVLLYGPPGTGKTLVSNFVLKELSNYTKKAKYIYINAIQDNTRFAIISKICSLYGIALPRRGLAIDEIFDRLKEYMSKSDFIPIVVIDEVDQLDNEQASNLLYDLTRTLIDKKYFCLVLVTNHKDFYLDLEPRTQSSLFIDNLEFKKYGASDLKKILNSRVEYGLIPNAISKDLLAYIAGYGAKRGGDARIAIDLLYKSAKVAENKGLLEITKDILLESSVLVDSIKLKEKLSFISDKEKEVLKVIDDGLKANDLYEKLDIAQRSIRRYLTNLEKIGLIRIEQINSGKESRLRKIFLNFDKSLLK